MIISMWQIDVSMKNRTATTLFTRCLIIKVLVVIFSDLTIGHFKTRCKRVHIAENVHKFFVFLHRGLGDGIHTYPQKLYKGKIFPAITNM